MTTGPKWEQDLPHMEMAEAQISVMPSPWVTLVCLGLSFLALCLVLYHMQRFIYSSLMIKRNTLHDCIYRCYCKIVWFAQQLCCLYFPFVRNWVMLCFVLSGLLRPGCCSLSAWPGETRSEDGYLPWWRSQGVIAGVKLCSSLADVSAGPWKQVEEIKSHPGEMSFSKSSM